MSLNSSLLFLFKSEKSTKGGMIMGLTKLDAYDYVISPGVIRIHINGINDPALVDILSEIQQSRGKIYVEGYYFLYLDRYEIRNLGKDSYIDLEVVQTT